MESTVNYITLSREELIDQLHVPYWHVESGEDVDAMDEEIMGLYKQIIDSYDDNVSGWIFDAPEIDESDNLDIQFDDEDSTADNCDPLLYSQILQIQSDCEDHILFNEESSLRQLIDQYNKTCSR